MNAEAIVNDIALGRRLPDPGEQAAGHHSGSWFDGEKFYIRDAEFSEFSGNDNRTISAWFWIRKRRRAGIDPA